MKRRSVSILGRAALLALFVLTILPVTSFAQRRWDRIEAGSLSLNLDPTWCISGARLTPIDTERIRNHVVHRYTYSPGWYGYNTYRPRYQRNPFRVGIWLR